MKLKIKKGDKVKVIAGSEKGKTGVVLSLRKHPLSLKVEGVALQTHFDQKKGLLKAERFIDYSNVKKWEEQVQKKAQKP